MNKLNRHLVTCGTRRGLSLLFLAALCCAVTSPGRAATADQTKADGAEIDNFQLTADFGDRLGAVEDELQSQGIPLEHFGLAHSIDEAVTHLDAVPGIQAILARHAMTDRQYCVGKSSLVLAAVGAWRVDLEGQAAWKSLPDSGHYFDNVRLYLAHQADWDKIAQRALPDAYKRFQALKAVADGPALHHQAVDFGRAELSQAELLGGKYDDHGQFILCRGDASCDLIGTSTGSFGPGTGLIVFHLDAAGNLSSARSYDAAGKDTLIQAVATHDGGTLLVVNSFSQFGDMASYPGGRGLLLKLAADGTPVWMQLVTATYEKAPLVRLHSAAETADGSLLVSGACLSGSDEHPVTDVALLKFSSNGKALWNHCYKFDHNTYGGRFALDKDGHIHLGADYSGADTKSSELLANFSADGTPLAAVRLSSTDGQFYDNEIAVQEDGQLLLSGPLASSDGMNDKLSIVRFAVDGSVKSAVSYAAKGGLSMVETSFLADGVVMLGHTGGYRPSRDGVTDAFAILVGPDGAARSMAEAGAANPDPRRLSFTEFQGIAMLGKGHYRLLGDTSAYSPIGDFDMLTALWDSSAMAAPEITSAPFNLTATTVDLPKVYDSKATIQDRNIGRIEMTNIPLAAPAAATTTKP